MSNVAFIILLATTAVSFFFIGLLYERVCWNKLIYRGVLPKPMFPKKQKTKKKVK